MVKYTLFLWVSATLLACNVPEPPPSGAGVKGAERDGGACGHAFVVSSTDYASSNVSVVSLSGAILSPSVISSGSVSAGASAALSGDVVLPLANPPSGEIVLIDRYPNSALTWIDPTTARVRAQLSVSTGFASNAHDYLELGDGKAYVTRYESNPLPGKQPFDEGGDVLVLDTRTPKIIGRIPLGQRDDGDLLPRADRLLRIGERVYVTVQRFDAAFKKVGDARVLAIDPATDAVVSTVDLPGLTGCSGFATSPSGDKIAIVCSGQFGTGAAQTEKSAVVILEPRGESLAELGRHDVARIFSAPIGPSVAFASERLLLGTTYGSVDEGRPDRAFALDLETGIASAVAESTGAFVFGDVRCATACGGVCVLADAESGGLRPFRIAKETALEPLPLVKLDGGGGLPPRYLGGY